MSEQVLTPRVRGFVCTTAHPDGCAANVDKQIAYAEANKGEKINTALIIGNSTGYGLASVISAAFGHDADTLGICFEREATDRRPGSAGWYNIAALHERAKAAGKKMQTFNGDAFSHEMKQEIITELKKNYNKVDLIVYSLASPKRKDPNSETLYSSVLKPIGPTFSGKTVNLGSHEVEGAEIEPANEEEIANTIKVMGGEDWQFWIDALIEADVLAENCRCVAYSYIGPKVTYPIYRSGTIGRAKEDLEEKAADISAKMQAHCGGSAWVSVNKALVTQASSAIPVVPLYTSILYKVMKEAGNHEGCIEQIVRLINQHLQPGKTPTLDDKGRIRIDDLELSDGIQSTVDEIWEKITTENIYELSDYQGFQDEFLSLFGFGVEGIDYEKATEVQRSW